MAKELETSRRKLRKTKSFGFHRWDIQSSNSGKLRHGSALMEILRTICSCCILYIEDAAVEYCKFLCIAQFSFSHFVHEHCGFIVTTHLIIDRNSSVAMRTATYWNYRHIVRQVHSTPSALWRYKYNVNLNQFLRFSILRVLSNILGLLHIRAVAAQ